MKHTILCVDDESDNVDALERLFRSKYTVLKATSGASALKLLDQNRATVIISDQRMPQMTGVEFLAKSLKSHPNSIRILLTGYADIEVVIDAINSGRIYRYVNKPWDPVDLVNAVDKAVERYELGEELVEKNRKLQEALDELQSLDQAKNQFMVLVNHELKTPLTTMLSFADLLKETELDGDQSKYLSRIQTAAHRLQDMINDAVELVSAETQQTKLDKKKIATRTLAGQGLISDLISKTLSDRGVTVEFYVEQKNVAVDEKLMKNVFRRLLHNAAKFATSGSVVMVRGLATESKDGDGAYRFEIENQGSAIDPKRAAQLLKPFTLNENTLNHSVGTGLGLSISHALLKLHDSGLEFESKSGKVIVSFTLTA